MQPVKWTGRQFVTELLSWELARCRRYQGITAALLVGLDLPPDFAPVDMSRYSNQVGQFIRCGLRQADLVVHYGELELLALLPETARSGALIAAERVRSIVEKGGLSVSTDEAPVTLSIGVVGYPEDGDTVALILPAAEAALAEARALGGNRVQLARGSMAAAGANSAPTT